MKTPVRGIQDNQILSRNQKIFLEGFIKSDLRTVFRLTGGTALSAFFLEHRLSEDLGFFSSEKIAFHAIEPFLKTLPYVEQFEYTKLFNRNVFILRFKDQSFVKTEFAYYPLKNLEDAVVVDQLIVDAFLDILVNKCCAVADRIDVKDYVDVYCAIKKSGLAVETLMTLAEKKCEIPGIRHILKNRLLQIPDGLEKLSLKDGLQPDEMEAFFRQAIKAIVKKEIRREG